ncbi:hypothetical protein J3A83DRAFT_4188918 [Scleroderma citrinum]
MSLSWCMMSLIHVLLVLFLTSAFYVVWTVLLTMQFKPSEMALINCYTLTDDNEIYQIAIDKKVDWFDMNSDWHSEDRLEAQQIVYRCWAESYAGASPSTEIMCKCSKWVVQDDDYEDKYSAVVADSIEIYLDLPPIPKPEVKAARGVLKYWENSCTAWPKLACMALDFLLAPALSVDAEHAFSGGHPSATPDKLAEL